MDYCSACRRHLNGALVCPGCGAFSPAPGPVPVPPSAYAHRPYAGADDTGRDTAHRDATHRDTPHRDTTPGGIRCDAPRTRPVPPSAVPRPHPPVGAAAGAPVGVSAEGPAGGGRAARRRQRDRRRKNRRRALVATAVALVGGGLTLASVNRQAAGQTRAAVTSDDRGMGGAGREAAAGAPVPTAPGAYRAIPEAAPLTHRATPEAAHGTRHATPDAPRATAHRSAHPTHRAEATPTGLPRPRSPHGLLPLTTSPTAKPHSAAPPHSAPPATRESGSTTPSPSTTPAPESRPPSSAAATSPPPPASPARSSSQLCLLVVCLG